MPTISDDPWPWKEPVESVPRGAFIVIEGLDRAGKTTQVKRLCDKLYSQGHNIKTLRFPGINQPSSCRRLKNLYSTSVFISALYPEGQSPDCIQTELLQLAK
jgi:GTPase SAR1 family protein